MSDFNPFRCTQLNQKYSFGGSFSDFEKALKYYDLSEVVRLNDKQFRVISNTSVGTATMGAGDSFFTYRPISVLITVDDSSNEGCIVHFTTEIRIEHYFIAIGFLILMLCIVISQKSWKLAIGTLVLWVICQYWFYFVYRMQEEAIVENIMKKLKIFELHFI